MEEDLISLKSTSKYNYTSSFSSPGLDSGFNFDYNPNVNPFVSDLPLIRGLDNLNTVQPLPLRLGVATWNVNHFGDPKIGLIGRVNKVLNLIAKWKKDFNPAEPDKFHNHKTWKEAAEKGVRDISKVFHLVRAAKPKDENSAWKKLVEKTEEWEGKLKKSLVWLEALEDDTLQARWSKQAIEMENFVALWDPQEKGKKPPLPEREEKFRKKFRDNRIEMTIAARRLRAATRRAIYESVFLKALDSFCAGIKSLNELLEKSIKEVAGLDNTCKTLRLVGPNAKFDNFVKLSSAIVNLERSMHKLLIVENIVEMFHYNSWLDVLLLNEVNKGVTVLVQEMNDYAATLEPKLKLGCSTGPHIESKSGSGSQHEYYPLVFRENRISVESCWGIGSDGQVHKEPQDMTWNKKQATYRPIVLYDIKILQDIGEAKRATLGIVHTTPITGTKEFDRDKIWDEIKHLLKKLIEVSERDSIPMLIGGDYYLTAEAVADTKGLEEKRLAGIKSIKQEMDDLNSRLNPSQDKDTNSITIVEELTQSEKQAYTERLEYLKKLLPELEGKKATYWSKSEVQSFKNLSVLDGVTVKKEMELMKWQVCQPVTGTNWKPHQVGSWIGLQIADYVICTEQFKKTLTGIIRPKGGVVLVDNEDLANSKYWRLCSDHFPVVCYVSTDKNDGEIPKARALTEKAQAQMEYLNETMNLWHELFDDPLPSEMFQPEEYDVEDLTETGGGFEALLKYFGEDEVDDEEVVDDGEDNEDDL